MALSGHKSMLYHKSEPSFGIFEWQLGSSLRWMELNWHISVYVSLIYVLTIFVLDYFMKDRNPFKLRKCLTLWNIGLCVFSLFGSYYMLSEMYESLYMKGFYNSVCISSTITSSQYWMWLFAISKIFELGDTLFIVLRKQKLIFLHWIHHISALIYTWYSYGQNISLGRWFVTMNFIVHSLMYMYYAIRALQYHIPRPIAMIITSLQIIQMAFGFYVSFYAFHSKIIGQYCEIPMKTATFGFFVYVGMFCLFAKFFINSYAQRFIRSNYKTK